MIAPDDDRYDADVPLQAVQALTAAQRRALELKRNVVLVRDDELIRIAPDGTTIVIRQLPARLRVADRRKAIKP